MERRFIPHSRGFTVSYDGRVFGPDGTERNYYRNGDGYITASILTNDDVWVTFGVHRLVALAFIPTDGDTSCLTVNHLDGDVTNNWASNLEWVTTGLNNSHAAILNPTGNRPIIRAVTPEGKSLLLSDIETTAETVGCSITDIWPAIRDEKPINGFVLYHQKSKDPIPPDLVRNRILTRDEFGRQPTKGVKVRNVKSGEELHFISMVSCAEYFDTTASLIHQMRSTQDKFKLMFKDWIVVLETEPFPTPTEEEISKARDHGPKSVIAYDTENKQLVIHESAAAFVRYTGLSKKAVTTTLKQNRLRKVGGWYFTYLTSDNVQVLKGMMEWDRD